MFCEKCGTLLPENSLFCSSCGAKIANEATNQASGETSDKKPPEQPSTATPSAQSTYSTPDSNTNPQHNQQQSYNQQGYQPYQTFYPDESPLSLGQWLLTLIIQCLPVVGFIMLLVWSFSSSTNVNKRNYARASLLFGLIIAAITTVICILFCGAIIGAFMSNNDFSPYTY